MLGVVFGALYILVCQAAGCLAAAWLAVGFAAGFAIVLLVLAVLVFRPLNALIRRSRAELGGRDTQAGGRPRDQLRELEELLTALVALFKTEDRAEHAARLDLVRLRAHNRQLVEVGDIGQEINAALPYRETIDRSLERAKTFLRADFVAFLRSDDEPHSFALEGSLGVRSRSVSADCCAERPDCPIRRALVDGETVRTSGHACTLYPHTMTHQLALPFTVETVGAMTLLATGTSQHDFDALSDEALVALRGHLHGALSNARKYDSIRRQVVTDHLTRLYNRRYYMNRAAEELERSLREQAPLSIVMIDIDHFKQFNDTYGHATGDRVLQAVAAILQEAVRTTDTCARHGGEEFTLLLPNTPGDNAMFMANRVRRTLGETRFTGLGLPREAAITISAGVATCPRDATTVEELLELADRALYRAKAAGRDQAFQYEHEVGTSTPG